MYHPTTRVLTILELLQVHASMSGSELARRLEVDRRTVRRYIGMLQDMGIPIEANRGPYGSYRLRPGFKLPPLMLNNEEALAITLSLIAARHWGIASDPLIVEGALAKIERVLPEKLRSQVQAVSAVITFSPQAQSYPADSTIMFQISSAIQEQRRITIDYSTQDNITSRQIDPYGLVYHWDRWYTVGWCHLRQSIRVFRLDRIISIEEEGSAFTLPPDFDSMGHVLSSLASIPWGWEVEVLIEMSFAEAKRYIPAGTATIEEVPGGVLLRGQYDQLDRLALVLMMLQRTFTVRRPPELREALRRIATEAMDLAQR